LVIISVLLASVGAQKYEEGTVIVKVIYFFSFPYQILEQGWNLNGLNHKYGQTKIHWMF